jgi:hypothetical protein
VLLEFQQALADLVASPDFCRQARADPQELMRRYDLSAREHQRLVDMVNQPGMALNCMLYRSNRLAPLAQNLYGLCNALGARLGPLLTEYSGLYPNTTVHFYLECDRFCSFIEKKVADGLQLDAQAQSVFAEERLRVRLNLKATETAL